MQLPKKLAVGLSTVATIGIIGGVAATANHSTNKDALPSGTTSEVDPTSTDSTIQAPASTEQTTTPDSQTATSSTSKPIFTSHRITPSSETLSQTEGDSITVVKFQEIVVDENHSDCLYTYSDGTTYQFQWKTVNPTGGTQTLPDGSTKTVPTTGYNGVCDYRAIGLPKN